MTELRRAKQHVTRRYAGTHGAAAPPRRLHWRRTPQRTAHRTNGSGARGGGPRTPAPPTFLPGLRFPPSPPPPAEAESGAGVGWGLALASLIRGLFWMPAEEMPPRAGKGARRRGGGRRPFPSRL